jgi:hypothetical protein
MKPRAENKFAAILQARDSAGAEPAAVPPAQPRAVKPVTPGDTPKRAGRTPGKGKRSDPFFRQVTAYIPQELHNNATIALRLANQVRPAAEQEDFSDLLTRLLAGWYDKQPFYRPGK